ncbi:nucleoside hydrolase [Nocardioides insulae]|uniref:nucleoside hydrolase n=1 Tax=Nocardioides insulae TaxID=394734 RepID=UPI00041D7D63|nr:nucleoside hydrolase [Nocardioides insulae]
MRTLLTGLVGLLLCTGCTAAYDNDGEIRPPGRLAAPAAKQADAIEVVVDTDLAPDDLVALAFLLRHPGVRVLAVTVPSTGLVTCPTGVDLAQDLVTAVGSAPVPISCGTAERGPHGIPFPASWASAAVLDNGFTREPAVTAAEPVEETPAELIARLARERPRLQVVALGPATELAALLAGDPAGYARIDRIIAMTGVREGPPQDDLAGEWNAAADPDSLAAVLGGPVPVTVVPHEVVPDGSPAGMRAPVVGGIGVLTGYPTPRFWDLATAAYLTVPEAGETVSGTWSVALVDEPGRLTRIGDGDDEVVSDLDADLLDDAYREVFRAEAGPALG